MLPPLEVEKQFSKVQNDALRHYKGYKFQSINLVLSCIALTNI